MDIDKLCRLVRNSIKSVSPSFLSTTVDEDYLTIRVTSSVFNGMRLVKRIDLINSLLESNASHLCEKYLLIIEAFTAEELEQLEKTGSPYIDPENSSPGQKAA